MNIATFILEPYDVCKKNFDPETCRQKAIDASITVVRGFLQSYDACQQIRTPEQCRNMLPSFGVSLYATPFMTGLLIGAIFVSTVSILQ